MEKSIYSFPLPTGKKLLLEKISDWNDSYLENIIIPLLQNTIPPNVEQVLSSQSVRVWKASIDKKSIFIKYFYPRGMRDKLMLRKSRAQRAKEGNMMLLQKGFLAPMVIAKGDVVKGYTFVESFLVTAEVQESLDIYTYGETSFRPPLSDNKLQEKWTFIKTIGQLIGRLHKQGIFHGDLRPGNILIKVSDNDHLFYFIDNERNRYFPKGIPHRLREKNLVQINMIVTPLITFTDRLRFFRAYLNENPELEPYAKDWIRTVFLKTKKRLSKKVSGIWEKGMNKIKILHLVKKYKGNYPLLNSMILGLDSDRFEAKVCYLSGRHDGKNALDSYGKAIYLEKNTGTRTLSFRVITSIAEVIKKEKPAILQCHRHKATVYGVLAGLMSGDIKIISHVHGLNRTRNILRKITNSLLAHRVSKFISVSNAVRKNIINTNWSIDPAKVITVRNGIDLELIDSVSIGRKDARSRLGIPENEIVFGTVGRLAPTKGQSYLIDAFSRLRKKIPHSRLVIIGDGPLSGELKKKADNLGLSSSVSFLGYRNDIFELLRGFDIFVLPSLAEGLSIALLEAMASKLPVIASNVGGIAEVYGTAHCGKLVPSKDVSALESAMLEIYFLDEDQKKMLGENARKRVEEEFRVDAMSKKLSEVYESMLN